VGGNNLRDCSYQSLPDDHLVKGVRRHRKEQVDWRCAFQLDCRRGRHRDLLDCNDHKESSHKDVGSVPDVRLQTECTCDLDFFGLFTCLRRPSVLDHCFHGQETETKISWHTKHLGCNSTRRNGILYDAVFISNPDGSSRLHAGAVSCPSRDRILGYRPANGFTPHALTKESLVGAGERLVFLNHEQRQTRNADKPNSVFRTPGV